MGRRLLAACLLACVAPLAAAQQAASDEDTIVVTAPPREVVSRLVAEMSAPGGEGQLARWNRFVCPAVVGLDEAHGRYILDRFAQIAVQLDLVIEDEGCLRPDTLIIFSNDAERVASQLSLRRRHVGGDGFRGTRGRAALRAFARDERPIRWWHVSAARSTNGRAEYLEEGINTMDVETVTRLRRQTQQDFTHAYIVVDAPSVHGLRMNQLADYLAMVTLAQLDPEADTSEAPSIMNLFSVDAAARPQGLTDWDMAYLEGLYRARRNALREFAQEHDITQHINRTLSE